MRPLPLLAVLACSAALATVALATATRTGDPPSLVVHEWGTFTSLQDEGGRTLGWVNTDDEPVPEFVHRAGPPMIGPDGTTAWRLVKNVPRLHPDVTMRLETPVAYFHPGVGFDPATPVDLSVAFRGGWLTEFFPLATADAPGFAKPRREYPRLTAEELGTLVWEGLVLGGEPSFPETDQEVWLAPRRVDSAPITAASGEAEQYLFYRGVGHLEAPLTVSRDPSGALLELRSNLELDLGELDSLTIPRLWLVDILPGGELAWRAVDGFEAGLDHESVLSFVQADFAPDAYREEHLAGLRDDVLAGLVEDGLFADEALGLLDTWEHAYFRTPGLRLFFLVPQAWTDHYLPLETSVEDAEIVRSMVARIELVKPSQRLALERISAGPVSEGDWLWELENKRFVNEHLAAEAAARGEVLELPDLSDTRAFAPADYADYLDLGRFRNALLLDAAARSVPEDGAADGLAEFIEIYGLQGYDVVEAE